VEAKFPGIYERVVAVLGEADSFIKSLATLPKPRALLYLLDCLAIVKQDGDSLEIVPRREEWEEVAREVTDACRPYKKEILRLVEEREESACLHCRHFTPQGDGTYGTCQLDPEASVGRLFGCSKFEERGS